MKYLILMLPLTGCALAPTYVAPELEHMSHLTQHGVMGVHNDHPCDGIEIAQITAHWDIGPKFYLDVSEGIALNSQSSVNAYGEIYGPREQFTAKIGYKIMVKREH